MDCHFTPFVKHPLSYKMDLNLPPKGILGTLPKQGGFILQGELTQKNITQTIVAPS